MLLERFGRRSWRQWAALPAVLVLLPFAALDRRQRVGRRRLDRWHWADMLMLRLGWLYG
jgi:hypothetical protein